MSEKPEPEQVLLSPTLITTKVWQQLLAGATGTLPADHCLHGDVQKYIVCANGRYEAGFTVRQRETSLKHYLSLID
jgi:hypothetical protein